MAGPVTADGGDALLAVRVTPRAKRSALAGLVADAEGRPLLAIKLAAPPVDGAANKALIAFLADAAGVPKSAVTLLSGETARKKLLRFAGISARELADRLETGPA